MSGGDPLKKGCTPRQAAFGPLQRKTFRSVLTRELTANIPSLGTLTATAFAKHLEVIIEEYYPPSERLRMGQVLWPAVDKNESPGYRKTIEETKLKPVFLSLIDQQDIIDYLAGTKKREIRKSIAARLFTEAYQQGGVLTGPDVATLMGLSAGTIYKYIREHEKENDIEIPHRGRIHDMGPTVTHKKQICHMVIVQGRTIESVAQASKHSPEAVTRYVQDYRRVHQCLKNGFSLQQTSYMTKLSKKVVTEYADLQQENKTIMTNPNSIS